MTATTERISQVILARWPFKYVGDGARDLRIDFLRGYCFFMMIVDHIGGPSNLYVLTGGTKYYISAAEAFYFLSGLTFGVIGSRSTLEVASNRVRKRTWMIYLTATLISIVAALLAVFTKLEFYGKQTTAYMGSPLEWLAFILPMHREAGAAGILLLYVIYMLAVPMVLRALHAGRTWLVLLVIAAVFVIRSFYPDAIGMFFATYFEPYTWAPLFFGALVLGFHRDRLAQFWSGLPGAALLLQVSSVVLSAALVWLYSTNHAAWPEFPKLMGDRYVMPPVQLLVVFIHIQAAWTLVSVLWKPINLLTGWLFITLGRGSLLTFTAQLVAVAISWNLPVFQNLENPWLVSAWQLGMVLAIWGLIHLVRVALPRPQPQNASSAESVKTRLAALSRKGQPGAETLSLESS